MKKYIVNLFLRNKDMLIDNHIDFNSISRNCIDTVSLIKISNYSKFNRIYYMHNHEIVHNYQPANDWWVWYYVS